MKYRKMQQSKFGLPVTATGSTQKRVKTVVKTDKINEIGERCYTTYRPEIRINNLLYVDDIVGVRITMVIENGVKM